MALAFGAVAQHAAFLAVLGWVVAGLTLCPPSVAQVEVPQVVLDLLDRAERHREAGRFEEAIASFDEALRLAPERVETYVALGALYHGRGEVERAYEIFVKGLEPAPDHRQLLFNAAVLGLRLERFEDALRFADRALAAAPRDGELHALRSTILRHLQRPEEALAAQQKAVDLRPGDAQLWFALGNLYHQLDRKSEAIDAFQKATKKDRDLLLAYYNLGAVLFEVERFDEALAAYRVALEPLDKAFRKDENVEPTHAKAYANLGAIHLRREDWQSALDAYGKALRLDPRQASVHYNQGYVYYRLKRLGEAQKAYLRALELDPELPLAYLHLGQMYQQRGEHELTVRWLRDGLEKLGDEDRLNAMRLLAVSQQALGQTDDAVESYRAVLAQASHDFAAHLTLARLLRQKGDLDATRRILAQAARLDDDHPGLALEQARLARLSGDLAAERRFYERVLATTSSGERQSLAGVELNLAMVLIQLGELSSARQHLAPLLERPAKQREAKVAGVDDASLATVHALLLAAEGSTAEAKKRLQAVVREHGSFAPARQALAVLQIPDRDRDQALATLRMALDDSGSAARSLTRANLGQALWLAGRGDEARPHLEAAIATLGDHPSLALALGEIALARRDVDAAVVWLEKAHELCRSPGKAGFARPAMDGDRLFQIILAPDIKSLCRRVEQALAGALTTVAVDRLAASAQDVGARSSAEDAARQALALPLSGEQKAIAWLVRGSVELLRGDDRAARENLRRAVESSALPSALVAVARNNLGVAQARLGELESSRQSFAATRGDDRAVSAATLNLGIVAEEEDKEPERALELYEQYLAARGARREEVERWVEHLRKFYR